MFTVSPSEDDVYRALRGFLLNILPAGIDVVRGQTNRVPEVKAKDFAIFWPLRRPRISTNVDSAADCRFTGTIAGAVLNVTDVSFGTIILGNYLFGVGVLPATKVISLGNGGGGVGTYGIDKSQVFGPGVLATGSNTVMQSTEVVLQIDVHGPNSANNAQIISTLLRDDYGVEWYQGNAPNQMVLFTSDPAQLPFYNGEDQTEFRWTLEAHLQANITTSVPQQYADVVDVDLINVDVVYPPTP